LKERFSTWIYFTRICFNNRAPFKTLEYMMLIR